MNYKAYKARASRDFNRDKSLLVHSAEQKFIRSLKFKVSRKRRTWTDCAFLTECLCQGWRCMAVALLNEGCSVISSDMKDLSQTPLFHALRLDETEIAKKILKSSGDNAEYLNLSVRKFGLMDGYNALHVAVAMGKKEIIQLLLKMNHKLINHKDKDGWTPLHAAWYCWLAQQRSQKAEEIIDLILAAHDECIHNSVNNHGLSHFHIACTRTNAEAVQGFLDRGVENLADCTALYTAVEYNRKDVVQVLLQQRLLDVNANSKIQNKTAMFSAARWSYSKCYALIQDTALVGELDSQAWEANCQDQLAIIEMLAKRGGVLLMENTWWESIMCRCWWDNCSSMWKSMDCVPDCASVTDKVDDEISMNYVNSIAKKDFFARTKRIVYRLLDYNTININTKDNAGKTILHYLVKERCRENIKFVQSLIRRNADLSIAAKDADGQTILDLAVKNCSVHMVRLLIKYKVDWSSPDEHLILSPLINAYALYNWSPEGFGTIIELLIKQGTYINIVDRHGDTPLHVASATCDAQIIRELLDAGSDINILDSFGKTAFTRLFSLSQPIMYRNMDNIIVKQKRVCEVLQRHVIELKTIGFLLNQSVVNDWCIMSKANKLKDEEDFWRRCDEETKQLKGVRLSPHLTLYDLLFKDVNKVCRYVENGVLKKILRDVANGQNFPIYGYLLQMKNKKCRERLTILKMAEKQLGWVMRDILPTECSSKILEYFEQKDLKFFLKN